MAPALPEPLSPTENVTSTTVTASTTTAVRSGRKLDSPISNKSDDITKNLVKNSIREKRNRGGGVINQTPTSSKRITRFRDTLQRNVLIPQTIQDNKLEIQQISTSRKILKIESIQTVGSSVDNINISNSDSKNEQMGISTAPLSNKNKILNNVNNNTSQNLDTIDDTTKDSSTAQLLADLTNEAISAEICLRNQLKDVNLVKSSGDPSSPVIQEDTFVDTNSDIVILKAESPTKAIVSELNINIAHMEAQFNDSKSTNFSKEATQPSVEELLSTKEDNYKQEEAPEKVKVDIDKCPYNENDNYKQEEAPEKVKVDIDKCPYNENDNKKQNSTSAKESYMESTGISSPRLLDDAMAAKKSVPKLEILSLQELPPVSTDSTMTASEVEDNLEERLSQLDGTAIDSPPPNNNDIASTEKSSRNAVLDDTRSQTPTNQQILCNELQELQQQLQQSPPTNIVQQVQSNELQLQQEQPQQTNCFTSPQSTTSSINLLGNASGNMSQSYIKESDTVGGAAELEDQDIEEVFKVLKGFEGGTTSDLNVCDLNVLFNEVYMKINETELSGNASSGGNLPTGVSSNTQSHVNIINPSIQLVKPTEIEEGQIEIENRQQQMQRKIDFLLRRLKKLQARYMCRHTSEEIAGLFEWSARQTSKGVTNASCLQHNEGTSSQDPSRCFLKVIAARPPASDWKDIHESLVPANQITTLLRRIESVANAQQLCTTPVSSLVNITNKKTKKALMEAQAATKSFKTGSSVFSEGKAEEVVVATFEENITDELSQVAGLLQIEMAEVQKALDSDATESSSGGESADEMVTYNNTQQQTVPITKRAAWRYSRDRAAIASRWSWLLSQISDLEIKIRQHSELHQEVVRTKGVVTCGGQKDVTEDEANENIMGSCRTRGYMPSLFRKRKLIQTTNIHTISKKAARPSTIKCGCQWPLHPCALCTGRLDPTAPRDLPDTMMMSDRIALLDSGYHPVLSFRENVNNALHFEAITKQPEWQQRVMRCQAKNIAKNIWRAEREAVAAAVGGHQSTSKKYCDTAPTKRRYVKKKDKLNNEEKAGGKSMNSTASTQHQQGTSVTPASVIIPTGTSLTSTLYDVGNGTGSLSTTTPTTPLVANKGMTKVAKKTHCPMVKDDTSNSLLPPKCISTTSFASTTPLSAITTTTTNKKYIHQTSDCLPANYDQFNPNQIPLSLISNNPNQNSSKNKHRKLSSSVVYSQHYNHSSNSSTNLSNGDSSYILSQEYLGGIGENFNVHSRTSSPTYGNSSNIYHKYERSFDRKNRTSYDIDNIVIPYSVAAATRVEVLPYKEIPTPKWRVIDNEIVEVNINKAKNQEFEIERLLNAKHVTNGHVSDTKFVESMKNNLRVYGNKTEEHSSALRNDASKEEKFKYSNYKGSDVLKVEKVAKDNSRTSMNDTGGNGPCLDIITSANSKYRSNSDGIKNDDLDVSTKKPKLKKIRLDSGVENVKNCKSEYREVADECNEEKITLQNGLKVRISEDEDISDDSMIIRHERALTEERRKFQTYLKFPWSTRSRANRRIDSRAESSGANTPDPSSPAPQTPSVGGGDVESIPSPLNPATPLNPLDTISEAGDISTSFLGINSLPSLSSKRYERRRTTSSKRDREVERRSSTPDSKELIPPYEPLTFPLTDEQFDVLLRVMPSEHGEDSKRFDECYLPGGSSGILGLGGIASNKYPRTVSGSASKRSSRASTLCGDAVTTASGASGVGGRRVKSSNSKNSRPISTDDNNTDDMLLYDDDYEDDYPRHHLAPNDDHLTADSIGVGSFTACDDLYVDDDDDVYGDQYGAYVGRQQRKHRAESEEDSSEEEPFQDDDPNDPEWRGETEERLRKKV